MDADLHIRLKYQLKEMLAERKACSEQLDSLNGAEHTRLHSSPRSNGRKYYYAKPKGAKKYQYVGRADHPYVKQIQEAHQLAEKIDRLDKNIALITSLLKDYLPYDSVAITSALPMDYGGHTVPASYAYLKAGTNWKTKMIEHMARFPENYPERKTQQASDGTMLKTISEVVVYERLLSSGLIFLYELPLASQDYGSPLYPDFTILSPLDLKSTIIIEYVGRMDLQNYREDFAKRIGRYMNNGYIPGVNLFFVFADKDGHIDSTQLNRIIADIKGIL